MHHLDVRTARKLQRPPVPFVALAVLAGLALAMTGCQACGPPAPLVLLPLPPGAANVARSREGNPPPGVSLAMARGQAVVGDATIRARIALVRTLRDSSFGGGPPAPHTVASVPEAARGSDRTNATAAAVDSGAALVPAPTADPVPTLPWVGPDEPAEGDLEPPENQDGSDPPTAPAPLEVADLLAPRPEMAALIDRPPLVCVNVNIASRAQLETLPRIGPAMAGRIVDARPFASVDSLTRVRGIGPATLDALRPLVCV